MLNKKREYQNDLLSGKLLLALFFFLSAFLSSVPQSYSGEFVLKKIDSRNEPESYGPVIIFPGTDIKAGEYRYLSDNNNELGRLGFLIRGSRFYFVQSDEYDLSGDINIGFYNNFFIIDAPGYGSVTGHSHLMFLVKYTNDSVKLLDVIGGAHGDKYGLDFISAYVEETTKFGIFLGKNSSFSWMEDIKDIDGDGNPEVKLKIYRGYGFEPEFELYLKIIGDKLQVNLNPVLYKSLFEREKSENRLKAKPDAYYIYGYLAKGLNIDEIKFMLGANKEQYELVVPLLEGISMWNAAFHYVSGEKFKLIEYDLGRR